MVLAGPDGETPLGCSEEEQGALTKLMPFSTLAEPGTIVALLSASVHDFDAEAMALTEPAGAVTLSVTGADDACVFEIRPRNATNVTLTFTSFRLDNTYLQLFDGSSKAAPLLATLTGNNLPQPVTSRSSSMLLVIRTLADTGFVGDGFNATYRADTVPLIPLPSGGLPAASAPSSACAAKRHVSHMCRQCVLATIASVCGSRCAQERLHLMHDGPFPPASRCLPSLAHQLAVEQVGRLEAAVAKREPFGLSSDVSASGTGPNLTDLYVPEVGMGQSIRPVVYVGLDSGNRIVQCDPSAFPGLLVFAHSTEPDASTD